MCRSAASSGLSKQRAIRRRNQLKVGSWLKPLSSCRDTVMHLCHNTTHNLVVAVGPQSHKVCHWFDFARASDSGEAAADLYVATPWPLSWRGCRQAFSNKHSVTDCLQVAAARQHFMWHSQQKHSHCSAMVCWLAWAKMLTLPYEPEAWEWLF